MSSLFCHSDDQFKMRVSFLSISKESISKETADCFFFFFDKWKMPPSSQMRPHIWLLYPFSKGLVTLKRVAPSDVIWNKFHASHQLTGKKEGKSFNHTHTSFNVTEPLVKNKLKKVNNKKGRRYFVFSGYFANHHHLYNIIIQSSNLLSRLEILSIPGGLRRQDNGLLFQDEIW